MAPSSPGGGLSRSTRSSRRRRPLACALLLPAMLRRMKSSSAAMRARLLGERPLLRQAPLGALPQERLDSRPRSRRAVPASRCSTWSTTACRNARSWLMRSTVASRPRRYSSSQRVVSRSRWLVGSSSRSTSAGATSCWARPSRPRSPPLRLASGRVRASSGSKPSPCEHRVDPGGEGVAALAIEPLEVAVVAGQHLRRAAVARLGSAAACSASECSSASSSANAPAAASQTVAAPPKSRCWSMTE